VRTGEGWLPDVTWSIWVHRWRWYGQELFGLINFLLCNSGSHSGNYEEYVGSPTFRRDIIVTLFIVPFALLRVHFRLGLACISPDIQIVGSLIFPLALLSTLNMEMIYSSETCADFQKNLFAFYGTRSLITLFITARPWNLSWAIRNHAPAHALFKMTTSILLGFPNWLLISGFPVKCCVNFSLLYACYMHDSFHHSSNRTTHKR
jgi:hypothetical protein